MQAFRALARKRKAAYEEFIACMRQSSAFDLRAKVQRFCKALLEGQRYSRQETVDIVQQVSDWCMLCRSLGRRPGAALDTRVHACRGRGVFYVRYHARAQIRGLRRLANARGKQAMGEFEDILLQHPLWATRSQEAQESALDALEHYVMTRLHKRIFAPDLDARRHDAVRQKSLVQPTKEH